MQEIESNSGLTKFEKELANILLDKGAEGDTYIGIMLSLKAEEHIKAMLKWIEENPQVEIVDIVDQVDEILG